MSIACEEVGFGVGQVCSRDGCAGIIEENDRDRNCSCHISPPCSSCTEPREWCPQCGWKLMDDEKPFNGFLVGPVNPDGAWTHWRPRPLDPTRIDWHSKSHSNSSMIKEGVYPEGTTQAEVRAVVDGTFGGRFESFGNGRFKFIAYTD
ncbi:hypothetical protein [Rhizobium ruizarguesonis]|uniref:hypothetical protein n=1 Tax=Rhizobium ruizarguesonis TaxID=2081791 RepID=UPI000486F6C5|nr:hypothetical protein [Rhizobium ruizarguesonis]QJS27432.1 hypothetical protein RLTA1_09085 [Rhizobium leguminosarum bv. trifolii TA1]UFW96181.1 hypothetical protein RlegTA1_09050 [Rhizobium ruizarguesonis]